MSRPDLFDFSHPHLLLSSVELYLLTGFVVTKDILSFVCQNRFHQVSQNKSLLFNAKVLCPKQEGTLYIQSIPWT